MTSNFLSEIATKMEKAKFDIDMLSNKNEATEKVEKIEPEKIGNWEFRDRQEFELGDITALSESIILKGQAQPIVLVEANEIFKSSDNLSCQYIVIAGYRRWLACKLKNIKVDAIIRNLNFEQAIDCLMSENEKETVSDYSKGIFYFNLLKKERVTKKSLYEKLGINRCVFDNYLSFAEVPKEIWEAVRDVSKVSSKTSSVIKSICLKGEKEKNAIISIADKISEGIGEKKVNALINKILQNKVNKNATRVAFKKNVYIDIKKDSLVVVAKKINVNDIDKLKEMFSSILGDYFK
jgi:ParB family chromosome partitioning protein